MAEKILAIIVAGGRSSRLSGDDNLLREERNTPKQYMMLGAQSVLDKSVEIFSNHSDIDAVLVVIHSDDRDAYDSLVSSRPKLLAPVDGGSTRQQSVHAGLIEAQKRGFMGKILIHDAARPFVTPNTITEVLSCIVPDIGAIAAHRIADTLKRANSRLEISKTVPRSDLFSAQTPQGFMATDIMAIHEEADRQNAHDYTDDASMFEAAGLAVRIVIAPATNFKITTLEDLTRARQIVATEMEQVMPHPDIRTGTGYDVHAFAPGNGVILCGYKIPFDKMLKGHSDADVALHAITDALLGTIGAGDIGSHFPPSDPQWKDASSEIFLKTALGLIADKNGTINNIDVTIICEAPKIDPHRLAMRENLARICQLDIDRVSIKATTTEKLGFIGRKEGIAAMASTTVWFGEPK